MVCFGSGAPGGIFLPLLTVGALIGAIFGRLLGFTGLDAAYETTFIALAMAGYFAAVVRAPVTGIILVTEMTGSFSHLLSLSIVVISAYLMAELLRSKPIYESLLVRLLKKERVTATSDVGKVIIEAVVYLDSALDNRYIRDVRWPEGCLVIGIKRGSEEITPNGNTLIHSGDMVILISDASRAATAKRQVLRLATKPLD
jgi:hypothetical protein